MRRCSALPLNAPNAFGVSDATQILGIGRTAIEHRGNCTTRPTGRKLYNTAYRPPTGLELLARIDDSMPCRFPSCSRLSVGCAVRKTATCPGKSRSLWSHAALARLLYFMGGQRIVWAAAGARERLERQIQFNSFFDRTRSKPKASPGTPIVLYGCTMHLSGCSWHQGTSGEADPVQRFSRSHAAAAASILLEPKACMRAICSVLVLS